MSLHKYTMWSVFCRSHFLRLLAAVAIVASRATSSSLYVSLSLALVLSRSIFHLAFEQQPHARNAFSNMLFKLAQAKAPNSIWIRTILYDFLEFVTIFTPHLSLSFLLFQQIICSQIGSWFKLKRDKKWSERTINVIDKQCCKQNDEKLLSIQRESERCTCPIPNQVQVIQLQIISLRTF